MPKVTTHVRSDEWLHEAREWERLDSGLWRLPVPGGRLAKFVEGVNDGGADGLAFVPDPNHEWEVVHE